MGERFYYRAYGLNIKSEIEIPELLLLDKEKVEEFDVDIVKGIIPEDVITRIPVNSWFHNNKREMVFEIKDLGYFYIKDGKNITAQIYDESKKQLIKTFILGTSCGMLLYQRERLAIHGGTVVVNNQAIILTGQSGAGKSTLTNAFRHYEYPFISDDVSVTREIDGEIFVEPAYPQQKICEDAMDKMGYDRSKFTMIDEDRKKYVIPTHSSFVKERTPLKGIFEIEPYYGEKVSIEEVLGQEKIKALMRNIYRIEIIAFTGMPPFYFKKLINIAKDVQVYKIRRPKGEFSVDDQIKEINKVMECRIFN